MITEQEYNNAFTLIREFEKQKREKEQLEAKTIDKGKGMCVEKNCGNFAVVDYNGQGYFVCKNCDDVLTARFEDEYN